jgi:hypothetical protein
VTVSREATNSGPVRILCKTCESPLAWPNALCSKSTEHGVGEPDEIITLTIRGQDETLGLSSEHLKKVVGQLGDGEKLILDGPNGPFAVSCLDGFLICASKLIDADGTFVTMYAKLDARNLDAAKGLRELWESTRGAFTVSDLMARVQSAVGKPN